jgi:hypothetical protein
MVIDYKLTYRSGTATAMLINSFHTTIGAELAVRHELALLLNFAQKQLGPALICSFASLNS